MKKSQTLATKIVAIAQPQTLSNPCTDTRPFEAFLHLSVDGRNHQQD